ALDEIDRLDLFQHSHVSAARAARAAHGNLRSRFILMREPDGAGTRPAGNGLLKTDERSAADEQDVRGIDGRELLVWMLAPALRRHIGHSAFQNLQQSLLDAFAGNVPSDGRVLVLAPDLIDFVNINDACLTTLDIPIGILEQAKDNVFYVFTDVTCFGQRG